MESAAFATRRFHAAGTASGRYSLTTCRSWIPHIFPVDPHRFSTVFTEVAIALNGNAHLRFALQQ